MADAQKEADSEAAKQEQERETLKKKLAKKVEKKKYRLDKSSARTYTSSLDGKKYIIYKIVKGDLAEFNVDEDEKKTGEDGWVSSEANLSQKGKCWVSAGAVVCGNARVYGDAVVSGKSEVSGNATVCEKAWVLDASLVGEHAFVGGKANVSSSTVKGRSRVFGTVEDGATVEDSAEVGRDGIVHGKFHVKDFALVRGKVSCPKTASGNFIVGGASVVLGEVDAKNACVINDCCIIKERGQFTTLRKRGMRLSGCAIVSGKVEDSTVGGLTILEEGGSIEKSTVRGTGTYKGRVSNATITGAAVVENIDGGNISGLVYSEGDVTGGEISGNVYANGKSNGITVTGNLNSTAYMESGNVDGNCVVDIPGTPKGGNEVMNATLKIKEAGLSE